MNRRVVITGMGAVTPIGIGVETFWQNLLAGKNGVGPITLFDASEYPCRIAAEVKDFDYTQFIEKKRGRRLARSTHMGIASSILALKDAELWNAPSKKVGIAAGISNSAQDAIENAIDRLMNKGYERTLPYVLTQAFPHATASETGRITEWQDNVQTFSTGCTAGVNAISYATEEIRSGRADRFLCPATDSTLSKYVFAYFCRAGIVSTRNNEPEKASRPFDAHRDGGILGEGAGCFVLEEASEAKKRGVVPYAEILGTANTGYGYGDDLTEDQKVSAMTYAMKKAMVHANCSPQNIDYIGAHGASDEELDYLETQAVKKLFGNTAYRTPMSSIKSMVGIAQNAAAVLQAIAVVKSMEEGILTPTTNYETPDPLCDLDYVPNNVRYNQINRALVFSHGYNGSDAAMLVGNSNGL